MFILARIIALVLILSGGLFLIKPEKIGKALEWVKVGNRAYAVAAIRVLIGWILINVSMESHITWIVMILGIISAISGIVIFILKKDVIIDFAEKTFNSPKKPFKHIAAVPLILGILLFIAL